MSDLYKNIEERLALVEAWVESHNYQGFEPFDGLTSYLYPLVSKNSLACRILQQGVRRFPINIRPLLGIRPLDSTKGRGYMAWGYLLRYRHSKGEDYKRKVFACLERRTNYLITRAIVKLFRVSQTGLSPCRVSIRTEGNVCLMRMCLDILYTTRT